MLLKGPNYCFKQLAVGSWGHWSSFDCIVDRFSALITFNHLRGRMRPDHKLQEANQRGVKNFELSQIHNNKNVQSNNLFISFQDCQYFIFNLQSVRLLPLDVRFKSFTDTVNAFRVLVEIFCFVMCWNKSFSVQHKKDFNRNFSVWVLCQLIVL